VDQDTINVGFKYPVPEVIEPREERIDINYQIYRGYVEYLATSVGLVSKYNLQALFSKYGQPSEIRIDRSYVGSINDFTFSYYMFYPNIGITIHIWANTTRISDNYVLGCINSENMPDFTGFSLWNPSTTFSFEERVKSSMLPPTNLMSFDRNYMRLKVLDINGMDEEVFYKSVMDSTDEFCIKIPLDDYPHMWAD